jgi:hypothetical protein
MSLDDAPDDDVLASLAGLRTRDVSPTHARRLRQRCHARLSIDARSDNAELAGARLLRQIIGPAIVGAWSVAYLVEIVRRAAAVWLMP